ncbi:MAG: DUF4325 domain-containing protein [Elusimicrobiota bacterium]|nr:DUF4325 domain-containing protein [Elusimicrobiota bacterium]
MDIKKKILDKIKEKGFVTTQDITEVTGLSRQAAHNHIRQLIADGKLIKLGKTKGVKYLLRDKKNTGVSIKAVRNYPLPGLREDEVFDEIALQYDLKHQLRKNVFDIFSYSFTELLNNAIDHSLSKKAKVILKIDNYNASFSVEDRGIGIFHNIKKKFNLSSEFEALQELIKGKSTTAKEKHSGEGIFFTSKAADILKIRSHAIEIVFDNVKNDIFTKERPFKNGTAVEFTVKKNSKKELKDIFDKYSPEHYDYNFAKTNVTVNLFSETKNYNASRSEAKRLLNNLEKFKVIILNFKGVAGIGQGFADEIFRIFRNKHPEIKIEVINANNAVKTMIRHVS